MVTQVHERPIGWPLGLENMNLRLGVVDSLHLQAAAAEPYYIHVESSSFSSFSSSGLDTQSTRSFFQDHSVPLGRLIGIRREDGGELYFTNSIRLQEQARVSVGSTTSHVNRRREMETPQRVCLPVLLSFLVKISRSKNNSKH